MSSKNLRTEKFRTSATIWCARFFVLTIAFLAGLFLLSHDRSRVSINPALEHVDGILGLALYVAYLALIAGVFWIPAGLLAGLVWPAPRRVTSSRWRLILMLAVFTAGLLAGLAYSSLSPSGIRQFLP